MSSGSTVHLHAMCDIQSKVIKHIFQKDNPLSRKKKSNTTRLRDDAYVGIIR